MHLKNFITNINIGNIHLKFFNEERTDFYHQMIIFQ